MLAKGSATFFALPLGDGTVFVGPAAELSAATEAWPPAWRDFRGDLASALRAGADLGRLRALAVAWGQAQATPSTSDPRLCFDVAEAVRTRRLAARFLPRFVDDRRGPAGGAEEPFRRYQLDGAFPTTKAAVSSIPKAPPRTARALAPRQPAEKPETDFHDEASQAKVLKSAARSGAPFCEICAARAAKSAA